MSLIDTRVQNIRVQSNLDKNELRPSRYGGYDIFAVQTSDPGGIITPELAARAEMSIGSVIETPVIKYDAGVNISPSRSITIGDDESTSAMHQITFATYSWGFTQVPAMFLNNEIGKQKDFEVKFLKYLYKFAATLDSVALAALAAAKTQVIADPLVYPVVGDTLMAAWSKKDTILGDLGPIFASNDEFGQMHIVGNGGVESLVMQLKKSGLYNDVNKTLEYSDKQFHFTSRLPNAAGEYANLYAVNSGSLGILLRFEREVLAMTKMADGTEWGKTNLPILNMPCGTYYYESKGDFSGIAGAATADMSRVRKEHYGFSVDVAFVTPYNSDIATIAMPIMKATIKNEDASDALNVVVANTALNPVFTQEVV